MSTDGPLGNFLLARGLSGLERFSHLVPAWPAERRERIYRVHRSLGYLDLHVYVGNEGDYADADGRPGPAFNFYERPHVFRTILGEIRDAGLRPFVWMMPDDADATPESFERWNEERVTREWDRFVPVVRDLVHGVVPGLEMDEYWPDGDLQLRLIRHLAGLLGEEIDVWCHFTPRRWAGYHPEGDDRRTEQDWWRQLADLNVHLAYQFGFDRSADRIRADAMGRAGRIAHQNTVPRGVWIPGPPKKFVGGEFEIDDWARSQRLGDLIMQVPGCSGSFNGGTLVTRAG